MFGGQAKVPLVLRAPDGMTIQGAAQHSQAVEAWFCHIPGIQVVAPSNPEDAKAVLKAAIRSDNSVIYFENKILYKETAMVPEIADEVPYTIGKAKVRREGKDVTIVSYSIGMKNALGAAERLAKEGIEAEVIDLISLSPWDKEAVLTSVKKTHRLCIAHEAVKQADSARRSPPRWRRKPSSISTRRSCAMARPSARFPSRPPWKRWSACSPRTW